MRSLHLFLTLLGISHTFAAIPQPPPNPFYWVERIKHTGVSAFNPDPNYRIFRNVMSYGAKGELYTLLSRVF
jgi:glucan 1,3-beta-glucosidase